MRPPVGIRIAVQESTLIRLAYGQPPSPLQGEGYFAPGALAQKTQAQCEKRTRNKFCTPRAQWPGRKRGQALLILRAGNEAPTKQEGVPRNGVRGRLPLSGGDGPKCQRGVGKATMGTKCPSEPSPAAFWLLCRRGQSNPPSADSGIPPAKIYGPLITLGLQNHFHSRHPR